MRDIAGIIVRFHLQTFERALNIDLMLEFNREKD